MIATVEPDEAAVMQMKLNPEELSDSIDRWSHEEVRRPESNGGGSDSPNGDGNHEYPGDLRIEAVTAKQND